MHIDYQRYLRFGMRDANNHSIHIDLKILVIIDE